MNSVNFVCFFLFVCLFTWIFNSLLFFFWFHFDFTVLITLLKTSIHETLAILVQLACTVHFDRLIEWKIIYIYKSYVA